MSIRKNHFIIVPNVVNNQYLLMIDDYNWWIDNEREILNWMADNLPNGIDHQQGMVLTFSNDQDRLMTMLKWG